MTHKTQWHRASMAYVACLPAVLFGCGGIAEPEALSVSLTLSDSVVSSAEPIDIEISGTNLSAAPVEIDQHSCPQVFVVTDTRDGVVGPEGVSCQLILYPPRSLEPGETFSFMYSWSGLSNDDGAPQAAGRYQVTGWIQLSSGRRVFSDVVGVRVTQ